MRALFRLVSHRQERMRAMLALIHAVVAVTPCSLIADIAFPVTCVSKRFTQVTEDTRFKSISWIVFAHESVWWFC
jgi:hypothetical protein